ncbi:MAG: bifunctional diaminohydroxyphosphoribosylaminopyrimidine deaminase/5-amino-6-(5-phosphoribosylamino)uracil reductase RibD [Paludibacteraceae bacterium]|nr:bifunctional diaminohydroxyphosphoribosylaminopyrimidine deaminase/5-amino-6-(5-phosphoribosylamino)uracil reductase RibD [Paludibacteraceae bacterium]
MEYANFIARCIEIARRGEYYVAPNPMVGAVLVDAEGNILAEGWHEKYGEGHAEVNCFRQVESNGQWTMDNGQWTKNYKDCTLFVSLEPCSHYGKTPPCAKLIIEKGVGRVVVGMLDPNPLVAGRGVQMLRDAGIEVVVGVMEKECRELNKRFLCLHEKHRPYVVLKWAQTADGFVDRIRTMDNGQWTMDNEHLNGALAISTPETKRLVHKMRAENMAIMVGTRTVLLDNPRLLTTHWEGRNPIRVTLDRHGVIPKDARILSDEAETIVYRDRTEWPFVLSDLAGRGIHSVLVEGGTTLLNHILETGIWDEAHIEVAPELTLDEPGVAAPTLLQDALAKPTDWNLTKEQVDGHNLYTLRR